MKKKNKILNHLLLKFNKDQLWNQSILIKLKINYAVISILFFLLVTNFSIIIGKKIYNYFGNNNEKLSLNI